MRIIANIKIYESATIMYLLTTWWGYTGYYNNKSMFDQTNFKRLNLF